LNIVNPNHLSEGNVRVSDNIQNGTSAAREPLWGSRPGCHAGASSIEYLEKIPRPFEQGKIRNPKSEIRNPKF